MWLDDYCDIKRYVLIYKNGTIVLLGGLAFILQNGGDANEKSL